MIGNYALNAEIIANLLKAKEKHRDLVIGLQKAMRKRLAIRTANRLRESTDISTAKINNTLFTLVLSPTSKIFFIEHLEKKYPTQILKGVEYGNLAFINKLRN